MNRSIYTVTLTVSLKADGPEQAILLAATKTRTSLMHAEVRLRGHTSTLPHVDVAQWARAKRDAELGRRLIDGPLPADGEAVKEIVKEVRAKYLISELPQTGVKNV